MATLFHTLQDHKEYAANNSMNKQEYESGGNTMAARKKKIQDVEQEEGEIISNSESEHSFDNNVPSKRLKICNNDQELKLKSNETVINDVASEDAALSRENQYNSTVTLFPPEKPKVSGEEYLKLKQELRERKLRLKNIPRLNVKEAGVEAALCLLPENRIPLFLTDIQHLILYSILGNHSPYLPSRWCHLQKWNHLSQIVVNVAEGVSLNDYLEHKSSFETIDNIFNTSVELVTPAVSENSIIEELASVPLTGTQKDKLLKQFGTLETAMKNSKDLMVMMRAVFPISKEVKNTHQDDLPPTDTFSRTKLLLSAWQMVEEGYPLPLKGELAKRYSDFIMTKDSYTQVTAKSPMFGLDCEMCKTRFGSELTRVSMVNEKFEVVYETFVKPYNPIVDYVTQFSGITKKMLENVTTRIEDVHRDIRRILPSDAILVGQSLNSDLLALKMMHPYVIDTSVIFNITGNRGRKSKLQLLVREFLGQAIQTASSGHDSIEDSSASLKLTQLKLAKGIHFGDAVLENSNKQYKELSNRDNPENDYSTSIFNQVTRCHKTGHLPSAQILGCPDTISQYENFLLNDEKKIIKCIPSNTNKEVIKNTCERSLEHKLTISHIKISKNKMVSEKIEKTLKKIDKWVGMIWDNMTKNSLYIFILGGDVNANGACFLGIKKQSTGL
ncbi:RNA exonuclease 5-like [Ctenocephalides felis]|uniref:RNA exonuclease 5-like n=1 Tax=Ctenocephalides felis TaxID=7515 RepID=UPI000E6E55A3|nr:RNA exonuclease 5-like [Ctenocephalides felis]